MCALILVVVEISCVRGSSQVWDDGALDLTVVHLLPIDVLEPLVLLDARRAAGDVAKALGDVDGAEA